MEFNNLEIYQPLTFDIICNICNNIFSLIGFFQLVNIIVKNLIFLIILIKFKILLQIAEHERI